MNTETFISVFLGNFEDICCYATHNPIKTGIFYSHLLTTRWLLWESIVSLNILTFIIYNSVGEKDEVSIKEAAETIIDAVGFKGEVKVIFKAILGGIN